MTGIVFVYILRGRRGALRVGRTADLAGRRRDAAAGDAVRLVYVERCQTVGDAILRERQLKAWGRRWKVDLIESANPGWADLFDAVLI